jgi:hypothetical protein
VVAAILSVLKTHKKSRTQRQLQQLVPLISELPFFKERGLDKNLMLDIVSCMEYCEVPENDFVFEYGHVGSNFFLILDGSVEVQIPDKANRAEFEQVEFDIKLKRERLLTILEDLQTYDDYREKLIGRKEVINEAMKENTLFKVDRRFTKVIEGDIPLIKF